MFTATIDASGFEGRARAFPSRLSAALRETADAMQQAMAEELRAAMKSAGIKRRIGTLEDSTKKGHPGNVYEVTVDVGGLTLVAGISGTANPGWRLLDKGGIVRPVNAKMLVIPIHAEAEAMYARVAGKGGLRTLGDIFFVMRSKGKLLLAMNDTAKPMFTLVRETHHDPHPYIDPAVERYRANRAPEIGERFRADAADIWNAI